VALGLPYQLARLNVSRALIRSSHVTGFICLVSALIVITAMQSATPDRMLWPALFAASIMLILLWYNDARASALASWLYVVGGAICIYVYEYTVLADSRVELIDAFSLALPRAALIAAAGANVGAGLAIVWCTLGYLGGAVATLIAAAQLGLPFRFDTNGLLIYLVLAGLFCIIGVLRHQARLARPTLNRAERDEQLATARTAIELRAAALMHDMVLNHLAAVAGSVGDDLNPRLAAQIEHDLQVLGQEEWLAEGTPLPDESQSPGWREAGLAVVVEESRRDGLAVTVTGDLDAVSRLGSDVAGALCLAVRQCLVNVLEHAGTDAAELAVHASDDEVSVLVIDAGRGFELSDVPADRLGIRNSIRGRIESVGGRVQVWSTPGRGTSIMMRVPASLPSDVEAGSAAGDPDASAEGVAWTAGS